jgi:hypothetical protein
MASMDRVLLSELERLVARPSKPNIKFIRGINHLARPAFGRQKPMEESHVRHSLEHYRSRPAQLGEKYETHQFESRSIGFIAPGDATTAICMACDTKLRLEGISELVQRRFGVSAIEIVTFTRLEAGPHHDGVRFANGAEVTLQKLGPGVTGYVDDLLSSFVWRKQAVEVA